MAIAAAVFDLRVSSALLDAFRISSCMLILSPMSWRFIALAWLRVLFVGVSCFALGANVLTLGGDPKSPVGLCLNCFATISAVPKPGSDCMMSGGGSVLTCVNLGLEDLTLLR